MAKIKQVTTRVWEIPDEMMDQELDRAHEIVANAQSIEDEDDEDRDDDDEDDDDQDDDAA